jgi:hypothetical protein
MAAMTDDLTRLSGPELAQLLAAPRVQVSHEDSVLSERGMIERRVANEAARRLRATCATCRHQCVGGDGVTQWRMCRATSIDIIDMPAEFSCSLWAERDRLREARDRAGLQ